MGNKGIRYERELKDKLLKRNGFFAERSAGSLDTDLFASYKCISFVIEVKSSKNKNIYLSDKKLKEQHRKYQMLQDEYEIPTRYFYRWTTRKHIDLIDKWMVFKLDFETTKKGNPVLRWDNGKPLRLWMDEVKDWVEKNNFQVVERF